MNNSKIYLERMQGSLGEKLFFIDKIDLTDKIIVDFGCADGTLLNALREIYGDKCIYVGVENNKEFYDKAVKIADYMFKDLYEAIAFLIDKSQKIVLITSSVLHELNFNERIEIQNFAIRFCEYWIVRDMCFCCDSYINKFEYLKKIFEKSNLEQLESFFKKHDDWISSSTLAEWLMKYPYIENWETENKEHYWSTEWRDLEQKFYFQKIYDNRYTNEFIKNRIKKDYDIDINWTTHRQMILRINK